MTTTKSDPVQFFYDHAGWSHDPAKETEEQGRRRGAEALAKAEREGSDAGLSFEWEIDPTITSAEWSDDPDPWSLWSCLCRSESGKILASLGGIDFGRDGEPWGDPYRRVVEAELAAEALA